MKFRSAKQLILHTCDKYWDAKQSYKKLIIYCFMEQGAQFPLTVDDLMRCYSTETIRRTFQELKREGEIRVSADVQADWNKKENEIHSYYSRKSKRHKNYAPDWKTWVAVDPMTGKAVHV